MISKIDEYCEAIIMNLKMHSFSLSDLARYTARFKKIAQLFQSEYCHFNTIDRLQEGAKHHANKKRD